MDTLLTMDLSEIQIIEKEERCLVTVTVDEKTSYDRQVEMITAETQKYQLRRLHDASYGTMLSAKNLYQGNFNQYSSLFIEIPFPVKKSGLHIQPQGNYIRAFHQGSWKEIPRRYEAILKYADIHGLTLTGFSYEQGINETVIDRIEDFITRIEIPILQAPSA